MTQLRRGVVGVIAAFVVVSLSFWNETEVMNYQEGDSVAGTGTHRGYFPRLAKS
jgi:hypothetical protein